MAASSDLIIASHTATIVAAIEAIHPEMTVTEHHIEGAIMIDVEIDDPIEVGGCGSMIVSITWPQTFEADFEAIFDALTEPEAEGYELADIGTYARYEIS